MVALGRGAVSYERGTPVPSRCTLPLPGGGKVHSPEVDGSGQESHPRAKGVRNVKWTLTWRPLPPHSGLRKDFLPGEFLPDKFLPEKRILNYKKIFCPA